MENIRVLVRVRPLNYREAHLGANACISTNANSITLDNKKEYTYDHVLGADSTQEQVFDKIGNSTLQSFLDGLNCCIFAYGQTGAGKTYTMQGKGCDDVTSDSSHLGLQPRLIQQLFKKLPKENNWTIKCTYLEIYNEQLIDLLNDAKAMPLTIREDSKRVYVENLTEITAASFSDVLSVMQKGLANRHVSATQMNLESSRSHSIFTLQLEQQTKGMYTRKSKMNFVDLAGSERQKLTAASGERLKEASNINKSLTVLGLVINSLAENAKKFIPYRDSKLTFLLRESLGGNSKTVMIATISAASSSFQETLGTLKFASRAKNIKNQVMINEEIGGNLDSLKAEIKRLKNELQQSVYQSEIIPKKQKEVELISQITSLSYQLNESSQYQDHLTQELKQMKEYYESRITELEDHNTKSRKCSQIGMQDKDLQLEQALEIQMELKYRNEQLNQRILELQQEDTILKHRRNEQQLIITQLEQNIEILQKEKEMLLDQFKQQTNLAQQYETQLEMFQEDKAHQLQELENKITELNDQLQINKDQMDTDAQTIEFQSEEVQKLQNDIELNKSLLLKLQSDCSNLHTQMAEKDTLIKDQLKELLKFKKRSKLKSKKFLKSLKVLKKEKENFTQMEQKQMEFLNSLNTTMELEAKQLTNEFIQNSLNSKFNQVQTQFDKQIQESQLLNDQKLYYSDLFHQTQIDLDEVKRQNEELKVELENNKVNLEGVQKYGQLKEEFQYQKEKLSRFLDSFDIINQKLIMKENEVLKLRSELKLEQTQRSKSLEEIDKLRTTKIELSTLKSELEQTIQQLQCCNQNETDESKQKKLSDNVLMLQKANQKLNTDLSTLQRQYKQLHEEKNIMQQKYEEKLMYQADINKLRKDINITNQLKQQLDKKEREFQQLVNETQILEDFFKNINVKRFCNYQIQNEGTLSEKVKSYFEFLDQCEQEFENKQYQLKTNLQQLRIEQANCNIVKEENRMLKMQLKI
ncbi:unnamed protein product (macronuclear) [Paramecium tetraurelia]|uniref:Kinesin-like protein n=1 Tax=Paramecium tetraurelia TaxID=5888 RepID=A0E397_PARTE|nr:uncharacterized protein GSPATT00022937001 [Paramecium tetraurelia]CAK89764.1 unnamed protein product [Paramecium tetraurelia]|eukprot:XP_001457161.1 hypothetical protein (macronuclear) [Paramecium tetraurelia strain d4-2]